MTDEPTVPDDIDFESDFARWVASSGPPVDPGDFRPFVHFNREGDMIQVYLANTNCYGHTLGGGLVVYLEEGTDRVVGLEIAGARRLVREGGIRVADRKSGEDRA
jgi:hypothetical protein